MPIFLSNVFNDPASPWYYVIGILFLALVFGALALYIVLDNKRKKRDESKKSDETAKISEKISENSTEPANETAQTPNPEQNSDNGANKKK